MFLTLPPVDHECDVGIRKDLCTNAVLSGGTTRFAGFGERMTKDVFQPIFIGKEACGVPDITFQLIT